MAELAFLRSSHLSRKGTIIKLHVTDFGPTAYGSDWFSYDFDEAIAASKQRTKDRAERYRSEFAEADRLCWLQEFPEAHTPEGLRRHSEKFGPEGVKEIADVYGVDLTAVTQARKPKRLSAGKRQRSVARARVALGKA
jgi:hypothetical protein